MITPGGVKLIKYALPEEDDDEELVHEFIQDMTLRNDPTR